MSELSTSHVASGADHYAWKGDLVQRGQAHAWVKKEMLKTKPLVCEECGSTRNVETANIRGHVYTRNPDDYKFLCKRCHVEFDGALDNLKQGASTIHSKSLFYNPNMTEKECTKCHIVKPLSQFYADANGLRSECMDCTCARMKQKRRDSGYTPLITLREDIIRGVRSCRKCGVTKPLSEFHKCDSKLIGVRSWCKECTRKWHNDHHVWKTAETSRVIAQREMIATGFRICKMCEIKKPIADFPPHGNSTRPYCKQCYNIIVSERRRNKLERLKPSSASISTSER